MTDVPADPLDSPVYVLTLRDILSSVESVDVNLTAEMVLASEDRIHHDLGNVLGEYAAEAMLDIALDVERNYRT